MNISNVRQNYAATTVQGGNVSPTSNVVEASRPVNEPGSQSRTVDMRNVSLNEINELIKSGVDELLDIVPFIPPQIIAERGAEYAANLKIDYIGQIQGAIEFERSIGSNTEFLERVLENVKEIDGMRIPDGIHVIA
jgi:hypothetical protein